MPVQPWAEPFRHAGSTEIGVLLSHGFSGSPNSMRPWGKHLAAEAFTVSVVRLPGHGTTWQEMSRTRWPDWYGVVRAELAVLMRRCSSVFMFGQSMGGTLALRAAEEFGDDLAGIGLVNPSIMTLRKDFVLLPVLSLIVPSVAGIGGDIAKPGVTELSYRRVPLRAANSLRHLWKVVRAELAKVTQPLLLAHSTEDHVVEPVNSDVILAEVGSTDVTDLELPNSYHVASLDYDAPLLYQRSVEFVERVHSDRLRSQDVQVAAP